MGWSVFCFTPDGEQIAVRNVGTAIHKGLKRWPVRRERAGEAIVYDAEWTATKATVNHPIVTAAELRDFAARDLRAAAERLLNEATAAALAAFDEATLPAREALALADALELATVGDVIVVA